jgi:DNA mismatch endonuclease (patch repair protein)
MDTLTPAQRSARMALIRSGNTKPEKMLRSLLHRAGFRFRLHDRSLPGTPDIVFPARRKAIFVHGCFWHLHKCQKPSRHPKSNRDYWMPKLEANRNRDARNRRKLVAQGWQVLIVWECEVRAADAALSKATRFLRGRTA